MRWESFDVVRFDLGPLLQGHTRIAKVKSAYNSLIIGPRSSGKDGKPDSWFLFDSHKGKQNPVTKVQEPVPEMSHISPQTYKILHKNA